LAVVVQHTNLGLLGRRFTFVRLALQEPGGDGRVTPGGFVERAVKRNRRGRPDGLQASIAADGFVIHLADRLDGGTPSQTIRARPITHQRDGDEIVGPRKYSVA